MNRLPADEAVMGRHGETGRPLAGEETLSQEKREECGEPCGRPPRG